MSFPTTGSHSFLLRNLIQPVLRHPESCTSTQRVPPVGNSYAGITGHWPGYCCLWCLPVKFPNQCNVSPRSSWEWKPTAAYLILELACALCSAAKLGSWPTWCGIIASEVRCELLGEYWWMALRGEAPLPPTKRHLIMKDHNGARTKIRVACWRFFWAEGVEGSPLLWKKALKVMAFCFKDTRDYCSILHSKKYWNILL